MARKSAKAAEAVIDEIEEVDDTVEELDDELEETESTGSILTAKEAAKLLGTDARTFRKFLRKQGTYAGQGKRHEIDSTDIPALKKAFADWGSGKSSRSDDAPKKSTGKSKKQAEMPIADDDAIDAFTEAELDDLDEIEELDDEVED